MTETPKMAEIERLADELERWGKSSRSLGFTDYAEGKADGIEVTVTHLRERIAELRASNDSPAPGFVHAVLPEEIVRQRDLGWPDFHPEDFCHRCGRRNPVWSADQEEWCTATEQRPRKELDVLCPSCFVELAELNGVSKPGHLWILRLVDVSGVSADGGEKTDE